MIKLIGEFLSCKQEKNSTTGELKNYVSVLDLENSEVHKVKVKDLEEYLKLQRGHKMDIPVKVNAYNGKIYLQAI